MIRTIALFALFLACAQARNITFDNCSKNGDILWVNVIPCDSDTCDLKAGSEVYLNGELTTTISSSHPIVKSDLYMDGQWVAYADVKPDACEYTDCPINANQVAKFALKLSVYAWPKSFVTQMRFRVIGDDGTTELACGETTISVNKE